MRPTADHNSPTVRSELFDPQLGALSTAVASLARDYGRSPASATSWRVGGSCVVTALEDFLTPGEQALVEAGDASLVRLLRSAFVEVIRDEYVRAAEETLGREVIAHRSQVICGSSICVEIFLLGDERQAQGASRGGVEVMDPSPADHERPARDPK